MFGKQHALLLSVIESARLDPQPLGESFGELQSFLVARRLIDFDEPLENFLNSVETIPNPA